MRYWSLGSWDVLAEQKPSISVLRRADVCFFKCLHCRIWWDNTLEERGSIKLIIIQRSPPLRLRGLSPWIGSQAKMPGDLCRWIWSPWLNSDTRRKHTGDGRTDRLPTRNMQIGEPKAHLELNQARHFQGNKGFYKCMDNKTGRLGKKCRMGQEHLCQRAWKRQMLSPPLSLQEQRPFKNLRPRDQNQKLEQGRCVLS